MIFIQSLAHIPLLTLRGHTMFYAPFRLSAICLTLLIALMVFVVRSFVGITVSVIEIELVKIGSQRQALVVPMTDIADKIPPVSDAEMSGIVMLLCTPIFP